MGALQTEINCENKNARRSGHYVKLLLTRGANFSSFEKELREIHPYEVPEILEFDPAAVCHAYAEWIVSSCAGGE